MDNLEANIMDKSMRSVFVGNIPYEATEEKLKDIFGEVGQVLSFKLVFDRETGKPKGYGFCEYRDQETALSAMRNLNGYEIGGRNLRVDNACTEKSRMEMQNLLNQPPVENPYGEPIQSEKAPEAISKAVASLPPEQMFELMKQMKTTIQNNPTEARQMLLQNPQLAYALLQAQVVMKIIDPHTAALPFSLRDRNFSLCLHPLCTPLQAPVFTGQDVDLRSLGAPIDPRGLRTADQDMRQIPGPLQKSSTTPVSETFLRESRPDLRDPRAAAQPSFPSDPRQTQPRVDPRQKSIPAPQNQIPPQPVRPPVQPPVIQPPPQPVVPRPAPANASPGGIGPAGASDQEKAALIMQVLQLSDEQIAMLPPEQRNSILVLKEQIAKSAHRAQ
ncbi:hypothetical protein NQ317_019761 [Molorchus minor]|uniref:RRM domain-containing protein n=1 Tax=Molorchus minor TaxID=1323400 RepID=A0ABQ9K4U4_9CUCU|nr:hypothetical protein NQ317_019761 [Molorchus minor]